MIVVEIRLDSAISQDRDSELGTLIIDNVTTREKYQATSGSRCDYRGRMYRKGALASNGGSAGLLAHRAKHTREAIVLDHARHAEPVQNLVAKMLKEMGYG